jgi:hypothetical protein
MKRHLPRFLRLGMVVWLGCVGQFAAAQGTRIVAEGSEPHHPRQPQVAVDEAGTVHIAYGLGDTVLYRRADSSTLDFSDAVTLELAPVMSLGMRRGPRVAASGGAVCITAIGGQMGKGRDGDVWAVRTRDGGASWSEPVRVNSVEGSAREGLHGMAAGENGAMCCAWLDLRHGVTEIMAATSHDGGATWAPDVLVYRSPEKTVCECCHPAVAYDDDGDIHVQWRNSLGGNRDMFVAHSKDGGQSFGSAEKLGRGTWALNACPMDGGALAVVGGKLMSAWRRDRTVFLVDSLGAIEQPLGSGEQPWLAATVQGPYVAWVSSRGGRLQLLRPGADATATLSEKAADPVLAVGPGAKPPVVAVWEESAGDERRIVCEVVTGD